MTLISVLLLFFFLVFHKKYRATTIKRSTSSNTFDMGGLSDSLREIGFDSVELKHVLMGYTMVKKEALAH